MRNKKKTETEKTPERQALEASVDAIMDPKKPDETPAVSTLAPAAKKPAVKAVAASIEDIKTAPQLSPKLRKQIGAADVPTTPLSIDKLDALTESIAEPETGAKAGTTPDEPEVPEAADDEPAAQDDIAAKSTDLDDSQTDKAVDEIVAYESDVMLAVADSTAAERNRQIEASSPHKSTVHPFSVILWTLVFIIVILAIVAGMLLVTGGNLPGLQS